MVHSASVVLVVFTSILGCLAGPYHSGVAANTKPSIRHNSTSNEVSLSHSRRPPHHLILKNHKTAQLTIPITWEKLHENDSHLKAISKLFKVKPNTLKKLSEAASKNGAAHNKKPANLKDKEEELQLCECKRGCSKHKLKDIIDDEDGDEDSDDDDILEYDSSEEDDSGETDNTEDVEPVKSDECKSECDTKSDSVSVVTAVDNEDPTSKTDDSKDIDDDGTEEESSLDTDKINDIYEPISVEETPVSDCEDESDSKNSDACDEVSDPEASNESDVSLPDEVSASESESSSEEPEIGDKSEEITSEVLNEEQSASSSEEPEDDGRKEIESSEEDLSSLDDSPEMDVDVSAEDDRSTLESLSQSDEMSISTESVTSLESHSATEETSTETSSSESQSATEETSESTENGTPSLESTSETLVSAVASTSSESISSESLTESDSYEDYIFDEHKKDCECGKKSFDGDFDYGSSKESNPKLLIPKHRATDGSMHSRSMLTLKEHWNKWLAALKEKLRELRKQLMHSSSDQTTDALLTSTEAIKQYSDLTTSESNESSTSSSSEEPTSSMPAEDRPVTESEVSDSSEAPARKFIGLHGFQPPHFLPRRPSLFSPHSRFIGLQDLQPPPSKPWHSIFEPHTDNANDTKTPSTPATAWYNKILGFGPAKRNAGNPEPPTVKEIEDQAEKQLMAVKVPKPTTSAPMKRHTPAAKQYNPAPKDQTKMTDLPKPPAFLTMKRAFGMPTIPHPQLHQVKLPPIPQTKPFRVVPRERDIIQSNGQLLKTITMKNQDIAKAAPLISMKKRGDPAKALEAKVKEMIGHPPTRPPMPRFPRHRL